MGAPKISRSLNYLDMKTNSTAKLLKSNIVLSAVRPFAKKRNQLNLRAMTLANESEKESSVFFKGCASRSCWMHLGRDWGVSFFEYSILIFLNITFYTADMAN